MLPALTASSNISLANGASSSEGTVVVDGDNYICDDDWDLAEAEVIPFFSLSPPFMEPMSRLVVFVSLLMGNWAAPAEAQWKVRPDG